MTFNYTCSYWQIFWAYLSGVLSGISSGIYSDISSGILSGISSGILFGIPSGILSGISSGILSGISSGILSGISSGILSGISHGILSGISSDILSDISSDILSGISSDILSDILSGILSGISSDILSGHLFSHSSRWGPAVPTAIWKSRLRSGSAHCDLEGPAVPTGIWSSRWRSGSAHWNLELAVEVRLCPLGSGLRGGGGGWGGGGWGGGGGDGGGGGGGGRRTALIKSNNPHLAGGEWISGSMNEPMNNNDSMNEQMNELNDGWIIGWMDGRVDGWMSEWPVCFCWATSLLSDVFAEAPLLSAASCLNSLLSVLLLLWASSQLALLQLLQPNSSLCAAVTMRYSLATSRCNPAKNKSSTMVTNYLSHCCYNAFSNLSCNPACQERRSIIHAFLRASVPMRFCHNWLQARKAGAPHQIDQRTRKADNGDGFALLRSTDLIFQKRAAHANIFTFGSANRALATVLCTFCRGPQLRKQRPYFGDPRSRITRKKNKVSHPRVFSPVNSHASELLHFQTTWWWHDDVVNMMVDMLTTTTVRSPEVFKLTSLWQPVDFPLLTTKGFVHLHWITLTCQWNSWGSGTSKISRIPWLIMIFPVNMAMHWGQLWTPTCTCRAAERACPVDCPCHRQCCCLGVP